MLERFRGVWGATLRPLARRLASWGVTPDAITWVGTVTAVMVACVLIPLGWLWQAALSLGLLVLSDSLDGELARLTGTESSWGTFLDASLDRVADGAIFGAVVVYFAYRHETAWVAVGAVALVAGQVVSYVKARAQAVGYVCRGGIAARADRLLILLLGMLLQGLGLSPALPVALILLAAASLFTVGQRMRQVHQQARGETP